MPSTADEHRGASAGGDFVAPRSEVADRDVLGFHQASVADRDLVSVDLGERPYPGDVAEPGRAQARYVHRVNVAHDCLGERVLGLAFEGTGQREDSLFVHAGGDDDIGDFWLTLGEGSGLVHHHGVDPGGGLDRGGILEQDAPFGSESGADHDGGRRRQTEGVGAGDDDDGDREQQRGLHARARREPDEECSNPADEGDQDEPERGFVRESLSGGLGVLRLLHERDDLGQGRVRADLGGTDAEGAGGVDGGADDRVAR